MALIKCKECGADVSSKAQTCPNCGVKVAKKNGLFSVFLAFVIFVSIISIWGNSDDKGEKVNQVSESALGNADSNTQSPENEKTNSVEKVEEQNWYYFKSNDEMTCKPMYTASVLSSNTVNFDFPYSGEQHANLTLRTHPAWDKSVIFGIKKGQFLCTSYDGCKVNVRFDDGPVETFDGSGSNDNSREVIFISNYQRFVGKLMKAKTVRLAANIHQEGSPTFIFDIHGFDADKYLGKSE